MRCSQQDLMVTSLGECSHQTPLTFTSAVVDAGTSYVADTDRVLVDVKLPTLPDSLEPLSLEEAGPRRQLFFNPPGTTAAIVTCGGLSPGLNNVIKSLYSQLMDNYGIHRVLGIRNGYLGLNPSSGLSPIELTRDFVEPIDMLGGTVLGSSRGPQDPAVMADRLEELGVDILFCIGGDGTQRGANALYLEMQRRQTPIAVVGIPKTIDNDIPFVRLSFGFATALDKAAEVIRAAHVEARDALNGIALVKLMGRHAGFIAAGASVVSQETDFTLVPEVRFELDGNVGLLSMLEKRVRDRGHAVIVVAEGAGQQHFEASDGARDASGNLQHNDIAALLRNRIQSHFAKSDINITLKYLDPSYYIRSVPANVYDRFLCDQMARHAAHAAMAGKTGVMIGLEHDYYVNVPISAVVGQSKGIDVASNIWRAVLEATRQPCW